MRSTGGKYILSMIDHKGTVRIGDTELFVAKHLDNNLRDRNPQLGRVEVAINSLEEGDIVACSHFTFYGDIGGGLQPHVEANGKKLFFVDPYNVYFKFNNNIPEPLPGIQVAYDVAEKEDITFNPNTGEFGKNKRFENIGTLNGRRILVKNWAFYCVEIGMKNYFKVMDEEILAYLDPLEPTERCIVVEYLQEKGHSFLDLSMVKGANNVKARVINGNGHYENGTILLVWRNNGVEHEGKWVIDVQDEIIIGSWGRVDNQDIDKLKVA